MEYAAVIWDPYHHNNIQQLEKVQRRAARWVLNDFNRFSSVTAMLQHLSWPSLQPRRKISRLQALFKILHQDYSLSIPPHFISMTDYITHIVLFYQTHPPIHTNRAFSPDQLRIGTTYHLPSLRATTLTLFQWNCKHCMELNNL